MRRIFLVLLLAFGLILSWTVVYAGDFYVIPTKKKNYAPVEKTGQTTSQRTHDDGDLKKGIVWPTPRFTDNNNGTVTDNLTGLIWLKNANCAGTMANWNTAIDNAAALYDGCTNCGGDNNDCGLSGGSSAGDWRLPNVKELHSLLDFGYYSLALSNAAGTGQWVDGDPFTGVQSDYYWSSTTVAGYPSFAWHLHFNFGIVSNIGKSGDNRVWPVRGGN